jgi:hypothetical protein
MTMEIERLRDEVRAIDSAVEVAIAEVEAQLQEWCIGLPLKFSAYEYRKLNGNWRLTRGSRSLKDECPREERLSFIEWLSGRDLEAIVAEQVQTYLDRARSVLIAGKDS